MRDVYKAVLVSALVGGIFYVFMYFSLTDLTNVIHIPKWWTKPVETMTIQEDTISKPAQHVSTDIQLHPTDIKSPDSRTQKLSTSKYDPVHNPGKIAITPSSLRKGHQEFPSQSVPQENHNFNKENKSTVENNSSSTSVNTNTTLHDSKAAQNLSSVLEAFVRKKEFVSDVFLSADNRNTSFGGNTRSRRVHVNSNIPLVPDTIKLKDIPNRQKTMAKTSHLDRTEFPLPKVYSDIQQNYLINYFRSFGMHAKPGLGVRRTTRVTETERLYLLSAALPDVTSCPDQLQSKVYLVSNRQKHRVGDTVLVRVDLYDQRGRIRTQGGDQVRVWLKNTHNSVPARVTDFGNGSYLGEVTLKWSGNARVFVSLTYSREFLRLLVELRQALLSMRYIVAVFKNDQDEIVEATPCLPSAPIPGYAGTCNLTQENGLAPWFCGQPISANLSCSHPYVHGNLPFFEPLPLQGAELELSNLMKTKDVLRLIPNTITIQTLEGYPSPPLPPCWTRPQRETWELDWHQGWLSSGRWHPDSCSLPVGESGQLRGEMLEGCLANTTVLLMGDSNARAMYSAVLASLGLQQPRAHWHKPLVQELGWMNSSIVFVPHARPFNPGGSYDLHTLSTSRLFTLLPPGRRYLLVLHYWLHFVFYPLSVFRDRIRQVKRSIQHLLQRHPTARVFLRGPHVVYGNQGCLAQRGDQAGPWMVQVMKEELRELYDRVWLLDFWPLTLAAENRGIHPPRGTVLLMLRVLFGYACQT